jgi:hypothetical protein
MSMLHPAINDESDDEAANRQTASLGGLAIALLLLVLSLLVVRELQAEATTEWGMQVNCDLEPTMPSAVVTSSLITV